MRVRELQRLLRDAGAARLRQRGSHETWRAPSGALVVVTVHEPGAEVSRLVLRKVREALGGLSCSNPSGPRGSGQKG